MNGGEETLDSRRKRALNQNDLPSTWPANVLTETKELTERILAEFASSVRRDGRKAFVLYVPRGTTEVDGTLAEYDRWLPWLADVTDRLALTLLDPTSALRRRQAMGRSARGLQRRACRRAHRANLARGDSSYCCHRGAAV